MKNNVYENLIDSFRRWKISQKGISENSLLGYGSLSSYKDSIDLGIYKSFKTESLHDTKNWFYISEKGINILKEWDNLGLNISYYDNYNPIIPEELKIKLIESIQNDANDDLIEINC